MPWLGNDTADDEDDDDDEEVDLSGLFTDNDTVDDGVTSGADPSDWDPIEIAARGGNPHKN